jgi:hypothetical protein
MASSSASLAWTQMGAPQGSAKPRGGTGGSARTRVPNDQVPRYPRYSVQEVTIGEISPRAALRNRAQ